MPLVPTDSKCVCFRITTPSVDSGNADSSTTPCENEAGDLTEDNVADFSQQHIEDIKQITKKISTLGKTLQLD